LSVPRKTKRKFRITELFGSEYPEQPIKFPSLVCAAFVKITLIVTTVRMNLRLLNFYAAGKNFLNNLYE